MAKQKVSDYIAKFLVSNGIKDLFLISGGGMMHMLDSVARQKDLNLVFNLNEQASGICADSYAQYSNHLGACLLTTGPGATNAITGCAGAWVDSSPVLFISGQCKREQMGQLKGLRIYGAQEVAIVPMVKPITKFAVTVLEKEKIRYYLEKAVYLATHGRRGPVWIDVPLDIQGSWIDDEKIEGFETEESENSANDIIKSDDISYFYKLLNISKRPLILIGHGVIASQQQEVIRTIVEQFNIPILATWRAKGVFGDDELLYMGSPGAPATRFSNYVLQNCDFLLIIGTRLNSAITAYDEKHFAPNAKKVIVDIEEKEITKLEIVFEQTFVAGADVFLSCLLEQQVEYKKRKREMWISYCTNIKTKYPLNKEQQPVINDDKVDGYLFAEKLAAYSSIDDIFVGSSSGRSCGISHMAYKLKQNQKFVASMGIGSMGWCIPSAIACAVASNRKRTIVIEGDGSLQHNVQELALIRTYKLPIKIFVISNGGYASIYTMQKNNFQSNLAGCNNESGLAFPDIRKIAEVYSLNYYCISRNDQVEKMLEIIMKDNQPCLCEILTSVEFDEIPKSMTIANKDGTFSSSMLEDLYPFVSRTEQEANMPLWEGL